MNECNEDALMHSVMKNMSFSGRASLVKKLNVYYTRQGNDMHFVLRYFIGSSYIKIKKKGKQIGKCCKLTLVLVTLVPPKT